jgi:RNase H-fold protein (predicted Holliday junction resolvase)
MGYLANTEDTAGAVTKYLNFTQRLNRRLNDLTQVINGVSMQLLDSTTQMEKEIQQFNTKIQSQRTQLQKQNEIITSNEASTKIKQEMVKYTEEKARNSENLLKLYSFLNIVTIGLLVYVYKAAGDS